MSYGKILVLSIALALTAPSLALAQAAGAGAEFNKRDRQQAQQAQAEQQRILQCQRACDGVGRSNSIACGQFAMQAMAACNLNVQKQTAACYQTCK